MIDGLVNPDLRLYKLDNGYAGPSRSYFSLFFSSSIENYSSKKSVKVLHQMSNLACNPLYRNNLEQ